jgi:integrase
MWFSLYSARRISETTRIEWDDINHERKTVTIRNLKDPRRGNVVKVAKIPASAYKILLRQPKKSPRVFPYQPKTISKYFTDGCKALGIKDLHFHDLRHAATTHLFKRGFQIQEVQKITLHSTWASLSRYCNLNPGDLEI